MLRTCLAATLALLAWASTVTAETVVVRDARPLLVAPDPAAAEVGGAYVDQVVTVEQEQDPWLLVARADGARGWLESTATRPTPLCRPRALGATNDGRLRCPWVLAVETETWTTWDFPLDQALNRRARRYGTDLLIATVERVAGRFHRANPQRRLLVGDLSRRHGGDFGPRFGGVGHASHQNGLDVDVFYPRRDELELPARRPGEVDVRLARQVIRLFARERVQIMFVGCLRDYVSASSKAERLCNGEHENHLHVRVRPRRPTADPF